MTRAEVIRMAREAEQYADKFCSGIGDTGQHHWFDAYNERFAALVAAEKDKEIEQMQGALTEAHAVREACNQRAFRLEAQIERLREALKKYGQHRSDCAVVLGGYQCTCGFNQQEQPR